MLPTVSELSAESPPALLPGTVRGRYHALAVLAAISTICYIDRQILVILQAPIKHEMGLSDTQLGLLTGFAFVFLYVICGIPLAHLADRTSRRNVVGASVVVWSVMTSLTGLAPSYLWLLLTRVGVGLGEAGASPPTHSMLADLFPPRERATAIAVVVAGYPVGILIGFLFGGWIGQLYGWRVAFIFAGLPGLLLSALLFATVREPARAQREVNANEQIGLLKSLRELWTLKPFRVIALVFAATSLGNNGTLAFGSLFLMRVHGFSLTQAGAALALIYGIAGLIGPIGVAAIADRLSRRDRRWRLWIPAITEGMMFFLSLGTYFAPNQTLSLICYTGVGTLILAQYSPLISIMQQVVPHQRLALASSVTALVNSLFGLGFGALFVGMASDALQPEFGDLSLRYALGGSTIFYPVAVLLILYAARVIGRGAPIPTELPLATAAAQCGSSDESGRPSAR